MHIVLFDERHLAVYLIELTAMSVGTRIFITKTRSYLVVLIQSSNHQQLFVLLGCLGERIKFTWIDAARDHIISRTFG